MKKLSESIVFMDGSSYGSVCCGLYTQDKKAEQTATETTIPGQGIKGEGEERRREKKRKRRRENVKADGGCERCGSTGTGSERSGVGLAQGPGFGDSSQDLRQGNAAVKRPQNCPRSRPKKKRLGSGENKEQENCRKAKLSQKKRIAG